VSDPYSILGLSRGASEKEVNDAYKKLAMQYHPDRNPGDKNAEEKFKQINAARDRIKNGDTQEHINQQNPFNAGGWHFNFTNFGGAFHNIDEMMAAMHAQQHRRNRDINVECRISLEDAFRGTEITVNLQQNNETRHISVKIPAGIENGNRIKVAQAGEQTFPSMSPGDLYVLVHVQPHSVFQRQGNNLIRTYSLDVFDLIIGGTSQVQGIDGSVLELKIPPNFNPDNQLRLVGQGMPTTSSANRGDLLVSLRPIFSELSDGQRDLIRQAKELHSNSVEPVQSG